MIDFSANSAASKSHLIAVTSLSRSRWFEALPTLPDRTLEAVAGARHGLSREDHTLDDKQLLPVNDLTCSGRPQSECVYFFVKPGKKLTAPIFRGEGLHIKPQGDSVGRRQGNIESSRRIETYDLQTHTSFLNIDNADAVVIRI